MSSRLDDPVMDLQLKAIDMCILTISKAHNVLEAIQQLQKLKTVIEEQANNYEYEPELTQL